MLRATKKRVKPSSYDAAKYDFQNARRLTKDQRLGLRTIGEGFAKLLSAYFTTLFRVPADVKLNTIEEIAYEQFLKTRPETDALWTFKMDKYAGHGVIEMEPVFAFSIVDRLFGGDGKPNLGGRSATQIEQTLLRRVIHRLLQMWDQSWSNIVTVSSSVQVYESNPYLVQIAAKNEPVILLGFSVQNNKKSFQINVVLPLTTLEPLMRIMGEQSWSFMLPKERDESEQEKMRSLLLKAKIPFKVLLGKTKMSFEDFLDLEPGDVLVLDQVENKPLNALVGSKESYKVKPGIVNRRKAVKIIELNVEEE